MRDPEHRVPTHSTRTRTTKHRRLGLTFCQIVLSDHQPPGASRQGPQGHDSGRLVPIGSDWTTESPAQRTSRARPGTTAVSRASMPSSSETTDWSPTVSEPTIAESVASRAVPPTIIAVDGA
jgi:hypothetical protein